jgi:hypothetical protein
LDIRFNKIVFAGDEVPPEAKLPLTRASYPITGETAEWLDLSECVSVVAEENCVECLQENKTLEEWVKLIGGYPTHPSSNSNAMYWNELRVVTDVQNLRLSNDLVPPAAIMPMPMTWNGYYTTLEQVAEAVDNEYPGFHQSKLIAAFASYNVPLDKTIIHSSCLVDFVRGIVMQAFLNNWAVARVAPVNFAVKYHVGRARPEEVAYKIASGELTVNDGVPQDLVDSIMRMNLQGPFDFTAYTGGSPRHPSWPAMVSTRYMHAQLQ